VELRLKVGDRVGDQSRRRIKDGHADRRAPGSRAREGAAKQRLAFREPVARPARHHAGARERLGGVVAQTSILEHPRPAEPGVGRVAIGRGRVAIEKATVEPLGGGVVVRQPRDARQAERRRTVGRVATQAPLPRRGHRACAVPLHGAERAPHHRTRIVRAVGASHERECQGQRQQ
jgi:hypothetical protein